MIEGGEHLGLGAESGHMSDAVKFRRSESTWVLGLRGIDALLSPQRTPDIPEADDILGFLIGSWECRWRAAYEDSTDSPAAGRSARENNFRVPDHTARNL
jgi:hypothetical protein